MMTSDPFDFDIISLFYVISGIPIAKSFYWFSHPRGEQPGRRIEQFEQQSNRGISLWEMYQESTL